MPELVQCLLAFFAAARASHDGSTSGLVIPTAAAQRLPCHQSGFAEHLRNTGKPIPAAGMVKVDRTVWHSKASDGQPFFANTIHQKAPNRDG